MDIKRFADIWQSGSFPRLRDWQRRQPPKAVFSGLAGSADAWLVADLYRTSGRAVYVSVESAKRAEALAEECRTFVDHADVVLFPSRDAVPYNMKSPFGPTTEERFRALSALLNRESRIYIGPHACLLQRVLPPHDLFNKVIRLETGREVALETLCAWLRENGFRRENKVEDIGTFSVRGGIVDIYPLMTEYPLRCEFWGDTLDSIREFEVFSQKSQGTRRSVEIFPMREFCLTLEDIERAAESLREECDRGGCDESTADNLEHQWKTVGDLEGVEWFLHHFGLPSATVMDYLPGDTLLVWDDVLPPDRRLHEVMDNYERHLDRVPQALQPFVSPPEKLLVDRAAVDEGLSAHQTAYLDTQLDSSEEIPDLACGLKQQPVYAHSIERLVTDLASHHQSGMDVVVLSPNLGHAERLLELLEERCPFVDVLIGYLQSGFVDQENRRLIYTDNQLFARPMRRTRTKKYKSAQAIAHFDELSPGDYVVHIDHGIGRFVGVERVRTDATQRDCMVLQYEGRSRLYVPVEDFQRVQKYVGKDTVAPSLSKLGTASWERLKQRTRESLKEMAGELVELYAKRQYLSGIAFTKDSVWQKEFEDAFLYEETPDQHQAIAEVKKDMEAAQPMDRLVCGDVGFGKTEVAMRAAFKAAASGYQVALLAPTTVLAAQHHATLTERMANFPVTVAVLSRFQRPKEQRETIQKVKDGKIDVLIGTHRILSKDVAFKNLGLLVVDEEQRFGVRHKEKLKQYRFQVDVLSMTATPIPRTLHMSLIGTRDLSIINTPPRNRLPIETRVSEYHDEILKNAIEDELERGGQVYVVHNRIRNLYLLQDKINMLIPGARVVCAHGQMDERELELVMREFVAGRYDVLLSTTIIENGLDIPNVNTIVVNRADTMGLSQLYQLRGRVGRSSEQAYAFLLTPPTRSVSDVSLKRLRALEQYTELGSGFQIAMRDLEIRGAGNILGPKQHGFIAAVGFELYCRLLKEAIDEIKGTGPQEGPEQEVKVEANCEAYLPTEYVSDGSTRIALYRQLSAIDDFEQLQEFQESLADRFGPIPQPVLGLLLLMKIKVAARKIGSPKVMISPEGVLSVTFEGEAQVVRKRIETVLSSADGYEVVYGEPIALRKTLSSPTSGERIREAAETLAATSTGAG